MKRQSDITRRSLLAAARSIVAHQGAINFTLEAVAQAAEDSEYFTAMSMAFLSDMSLVHIWRTGVAEALKVDACENTDPSDALIVRLAADGIWASGLYNTYTFESARRKQILDKLVAMTRS